MFTFLTAPVNFRCAKAVFEELVEFRFMCNLRVLGFDLLKLDGDLVIGLIVNA